MQLTVGNKVKFQEEKMRYTVQAADSRYAVCTKPFNPRGTVLYTVVDFQDQVRGTEDLVFGHSVETQEHCEQMLSRLNGVNGYPTEVSHRNRVPLRIESVS